MGALTVSERAGYVYQDHANQTHKSNFKQQWSPFMSI